ncbi:MAG: hypothetical protein O7A08_09620 [SAR324 cluster bacterium]|nr:hypothetical protein [SAR324 cluster bacterium]
MAGVTAAQSEDGSRTWKDSSSQDDANSINIVQSPDDRALYLILQGDATDEWPDPGLALGGLLDETPEKWLEALDNLRREPERTRRLLLLAIELQLESPRRWRIFHHMIEFGLAEDIPLLLEQLETVESPLERKALLGAARSLYPAANRSEDLSLAVEEFAFVQTKPPAALNGHRAGKTQLSSYVFRYYHRESVSVQVIRRLLPLRGRTFASEAALAEAMSHRLGKNDWPALRAKLLEPVQPLPEQVAQEGLLRVRLRNPLSRPLMLRVTFNVWFAKFEKPPEEKLVFLDPGESKRLDFSVRAVKATIHPAMRVGMRMWEVNGPFIPIFQKLYVSF